MSDWLDNAEICQRALDIASGLPRAGRAEHDSFYAYLVVDEPIIQLVPGYFLPVRAEPKIEPESLRLLAVAAKLENARARWIDELVDHQEFPVSPVSSHELNEAVIDLVHDCYSEVLPDESAAAFFKRLGILYARNSLSLVLDGKRWHSLERPVTLAAYEAHARVRHSPVRATLDALLTLVGADRDQWARATDSWHAWGFGAQLYDDALDIEEDFRSGTLTWTVGRTLECFEGGVPTDPDDFYETALRKGIVVETLKYAEAYFARAAELARQDFPRWVPVQEGCGQQARTLREDYERLLLPRRSAL